MIDRSTLLFNKAKHYIPGGVNSPVRAFQAVGGIPRFIKSAYGPYIIDVDNNRYIDYVCSWGPLILGHAHPAVLRAMQEAAEKGLSFGAPCEGEVTLATLISERIPSMEKIRLVNSGTEAAMSAIRLARGATRRSKIIKFEGCYHGHADCLLVKAGSGALTFGQPSSPGVPLTAVQDTLIATFNKLDSVEALFERHGEDIACIIIEPIAGNMNLIPANASFLKGLRELANQYRSLLIFDEVITGFRVAPGGAQSLYDIKPDLTVLGKIIGGGMPIGAYGGRRDVMDQLAPNGPVYQAGTLSGNPVAVAAGLATLNELANDNFYTSLKEKTEQLVLGILSRAQAAGLPFTANYSCGIFGLFFTDKAQITHYGQAITSDSTRFQQFFHTMLDQNIYLAPSPFECGFISATHGEEEITQTLNAIEKAFAKFN